DRRRHVWTTTLLAPGDEFTRILSVLERQVAATARFDRVDGLDWCVTAGDENQIEGDKRCRRRDLRHRTQRPQLFTRRRIVTANLMWTDSDQLGARLAFIDRRRTPRRKLFARCFPEFFTGLDVVRGDEGVLLNVRLHDHHVLVDDR